MALINLDSATPQGGLVAKVLAGEFRAVARLITLVENDAPEAIGYLQDLFPHTGRCFSIGITGAPGAGKSMLVDGLASYYREAGLKVGIIAVDPTSPFSGGAILGDRIRMQSRSLDSGTFIRSMATRGTLGGLARSTNDVLMVLDAAGFEVVLIETVGVGQDEVEIARTAHATLVLLVPGMGDDIQAMKAGIMEIGDVFVVNKADHAGVDRVEAELRALLSLGSRSDQWIPPIVRTVASEGAGISECAQAIEDYKLFLRSSEFQQERSIKIQKDRVVEILQARILAQVVDTPSTAGRLDVLAGLIAERRLDPYTVAENLLASLGAWSRDSTNTGTIQKVEHLGIAVRSLAEALTFYEGTLGLERTSMEDVTAHKTRVAILPLGETRIELLEPMAADSAVAHFLDKRGEGLHHVCFQVDNIHEMIVRLKTAGIRVIDEQPREGADGRLVCFIHPSSANGVLIELSQH